MTWSFREFFEKEKVKANEMNEIEEGIKQALAEVLPSGGSTGESLVKTSGTNYATSWAKRPTEAEVETIAINANQGEEGTNLEAFGGKGDCKVLTGGKITSGKNVLTFTSAAFTSADVNKVINVVGAVEAKAFNKSGTEEEFWQTLATTIKEYKSPTEVVLSANASKTTTAAVVVYGTNNTEAFTKAFKALGEIGGGQLHLTRGSNYAALPSTSQAFTVPANTIIEGYGSTVTALCAGASEPYTKALSIENEISGGFCPSGTEGKGYVSLMAHKEGIVKVKGVTFWKVPSAEKVTAVAVGSSAEELSFEDCRWKNGFGFGMECSVAARVVMDRCEVEGVKVKTTNPFGSMGILFDYSGEGGELIISDTYFHGNGLEECIHDHCLYIYKGVAYDIKGCTFNKHGNGRYILGGYGGTSNENSAAFCQVTNCVFGKETECSIGAVQTNPYNTTNYVNCTFNMSKKAVQIEGNSVFTGCSFPHGQSASNPLVQAGEVKAAISATFIGCRFRTEGATAGTTGNENVFELGTPGATLKETSLKLIACEFTGIPESAFVVCYPHDENDSIRIEATNCGFAGYTGKTVPAFQAQGEVSGTKTLMRIIGCRFDSTLTSVINRNGSASTVIEATLLDNELNNSGSVVENAPLAAFREWGSYGSKGSLSQGIASFAGVKLATVSSSAVTTTSHILLTILEGGKPENVAFVKKREAGKFEIELKESATCSVAWAIIS